MRLPLLLLACTLTAAAAPAQTTWHNLHFGQSRDEVRAQLSTQNLSLQTTPDNSLQTAADYDLNLPGLQHPLSMIATFHFSDAGTLADVTLAVDLPAVRRYWAPLGSDDVIVSFVSEKLAIALSGIYGTAIYRSPSCDVSPTPAPAFCTSVWHAQDQTIELDRPISPRGPRLLIRYQPLATDL
jgi:hypothetical protein